MTPTPTPPPPDDEALGLLYALAAEVGLLVALLAACAFAVSWVLIRAARIAPAALVVVALTVLTLVSLIGASVGRSAELVTIAATGMGALAGAVTSLFRADNLPPDEVRVDQLPPDPDP